VQSSSHQVRVRSNVLRCWKYCLAAKRVSSRSDGEYRSSSAILERQVERIQHVVGGCKSLRTLAGIRRIRISVERLKLQATGHSPIELQHEGIVLDVTLSEIVVMRPKW